MPLSAHLLLAVTALGCFATVFAVPMDGIIFEYQCRCLTKTDTYIKPQYLKKIELFPAGSHCRNFEIITTLKDGRIVCLDPKAEWVKKFIYAITAGRNSRQK